MDKASEHIDWSPDAFRQVCLNGTVEGNKLMHNNPLIKADERGPAALKRLHASVFILGTD
ncbi:hypothetical protein PgNI_11394, partial [Pyricularia grisea]|uniref:Uncharacterized protein n=1 Tax=Pyricularia grisea TaxID=148305 RepID=A0A6P8AP79_PYRGI